MQSTIEQARSFRHNATPAEAELWHHLRRRNLGVKFRRQAPIGNYIADFVCLEKKLVIEVDGDSHGGIEKDIERTKYLNSLGFMVLRFWNDEVNENIEGVITKLVRHLETGSG